MDSSPSASRDVGSTNLVLPRLFDGKIPSKSMTLFLTSNGRPSSRSRCKGYRAHCANKYARKLLIILYSCTVKALKSSSTFIRPFCFAFCVKHAFILRMNEHKSKRTPRRTIIIRIIRIRIIVLRQKALPVFPWLRSRSQGKRARCWGESYTKLSGPLSRRLSVL